jgi:hypothetical protein
MSNISSILLYQFPLCFSINIWFCTFIFPLLYFSAWGMQFTVHRITANIILLPTTNTHKRPSFQLIHNVEKNIFTASIATLVVEDLFKNKSLFFSKNK